MAEPNVVDNNTNEPTEDTTSSSPTPPKRSGKVRAHKAVKTTANVTRKVLEIFAKLPTPVKIAILVIILLIIIIVVVVLKAEAAESTNAMTSSMNKVVENSDDLSDEAKESYEKSGSLIKFPLSKLLEMYDYFSSEGEFSGQEIRDNYDYVLGTNEVQIKNGSGTSSGPANIDYDVNFTKGQDGVRDDKRVEYITGSTNRISTYKTGSSYTWSNGSVGGCPVEIVDVDIQYWNRSGGTSTTTLQVNSKIAKFIKPMFDDIYNDPSHPVIEAVGCFRSSDGYPGHPFGVAIDINPDQNPQPGSYGSISNYKPGVDPLSMDENHPIVKIIRDKYGWRWRRRFFSRLY